MTVPTGRDPLANLERLTNGSGTDGFPNGRTYAPNPTSQTKESKMTFPTNARPTDEEMLRAWDLPNPFDPTILTTSVAGDYLTEAQTILRSKSTTAQPGGLERDHARAVSIYLQRCAVITEVWAAADQGPNEGLLVTVHKSGWNDEGEYGWSVDTVYHEARKTGFTLVTWTDGVANDWCQIVRDQDHAEKFLRVLAHVVKHEENLTQDWEEDAPVDCAGWKVQTQITATVVLNSDGSPERVEVPMTFDPDFVLGIIAPGATDLMWTDPADHEQEPTDAANAVLNAVKGGEVYAPHID